MAVAGDILVKLAVDFAEFVAGMDKANAKLDEQGKRLADHGTKLDGLAKQLIGLAQSTSIEGFASKLEGLVSTFGKFAAVGAAIGLAGTALAAFVKQQQQIEDYALSVDKLRNTFAITGEQAQMFQRIAEQLKVPVEQLVKDLQGDPATLNAVTKAYKEQFAALDPKKIGDVAAASRNLTAAWEEFKNTLDQKSNKDLENTKNNVDALTAALNWLTKGIKDARAEAEHMPDPNAMLADPNAWYNRPLFGGRPPTGPGAGRDPRASGREGAAAAAAREAEQDAIRLQQDSPDALYPQGRNRTAAELAQLRADQLARQRNTAPPAATGGGGGRTDDDLVEGQIRRYDNLAAAAEKAYKTIETYQGQDIEQLQRNVTVQRQIDDIVGKLDAKYIEAHKDELARLRLSVTAAEEARAAQDKLMKTTQDAIDTERKYGDGTAAVARAQKQLNEQYALGRTQGGAIRLSTEAYNRALKEQLEQIQQNALAQRRYDDDLGSLAAGFEHAANAYARANDLYSQGEQVFNGLTASMGEGLDVLLGKSDKTFGQIAADFATMLAKMALQAATSQVFKSIFGAITPGAVGLGTSGVVVPPGFSGVTVPMPGMQGGGPVAPGVSYRVGEGGPERFVPSVAGTIIPNGATSSGGVTVNVDMNQQQGARDPTAALEFGRRVRAAVVDVIAQEKRPGGTLYARHNA